MKTMARLLALMVVVFFIGCATQQGAGGPGRAATQASSSGGKQLTDADYKRLGIQETGIRK